MMELVTTLLQAVIAVAVPILSTFAVKWFQAKTAQAAAETDNERTQAYLQEIAEAVSAAVAHTSQTYVDALKDSDTFTAENQKEALDKAKNTALCLLSQSALSFISMVYDDAAAYLEAKIEREVRLQKDGGLFLGAAVDVE